MVKKLSMELKTVNSYVSKYQIIMNQIEPE